MRCSLPVAVLLFLLGPALAAPAAQLDGLRDARYCEIFVLRGTLPDAEAEVYNSIGLNPCPQAKWDRVVPPALADELGATAVFLNGPRHFLMDSVTAVTGAKRTLAGIRMTRVASIPIHTAADLDRSLYADRTIARRNTWRWKQGRRVFELVAPGGDTYVMQSYARIVEPDLTLSDLATIAPRLTTLPDGWRYRTRRLLRPMALGARGAATIIQDDLQNTYQLATTRRRSGKRERRSIHVAGATKSVPSNTEGTVDERGTVTGAPFGQGTIALVGTFTDGTVNARFRLRFPRGEISGTAVLACTTGGDEVDCRGAARFVRGTGAFRDITSGELAVHLHTTADSQSGTLTVDGFATY